MAKRLNFSDQSKAKAVLEALRGVRTCRRSQRSIGCTQARPVSTWKRQAIDGIADVFSCCRHSGLTDADVKELHAKTGRLVD